MSLRTGIRTSSSNYVHSFSEAQEDSWHSLNGRRFFKPAKCCLIFMQSCLKRRRPSQAGLTLIQSVEVTTERFMTLVERDAIGSECEETTSWRECLGIKFFSTTKSKRIDLCRCSSSSIPPNECLPPSIVPPLLLTIHCWSSLRVNGLSFGLLMALTRACPSIRYDVARI